MPALTLPTLTEDTIDDLLYFSRTSSLSDLQSTISALAKRTETTPQNIILAAIDAESGNNLLHMAGANGHVETLNYLLHPTPFATAPPNTVLLNAQNKAGNTPLHWAALNGHLDAVKLLVEAGADMGMKNEAGKDVLTEAEVGEKEEVAVWLMGRMETYKGSEGERDGNGPQQEMDVGGVDKAEEPREDEYEASTTAGNENVG